jgi:hypothetical protein
MPGVRGGSFMMPGGRVLGEYGASAADVKAEYFWLATEAANDNRIFGGDDGTGRIKWLQNSKGIALRSF